jgi:hypothetical protein
MSAMGVKSRAGMYALDMTEPFRMQMEQLQRQPVVISSQWNEKVSRPQ